MSDRLLYVAVLLSVFGLLLLVFISTFFDLPYVRVGDVDSRFLEKNVHLKGVVSGVHQFKGGSILLSVTQDNSTIDVYLPYSIASTLNKTTVSGASVDLIGVVQLYDGKVEVVVDKQEDLVLK